MVGHKARATSCAAAGLDWILGRINEDCGQSLRGWTRVGKGCQGSSRVFIPGGCGSKDHGLLMGLGRSG